MMTEPNTQTATFKVNCHVAFMHVYTCTSFNFGFENNLEYSGKVQHHLLFKSALNCFFNYMFLSLSLSSLSLSLLSGFYISNYFESMESNLPASYPFSSR